MKTKKDVDAMKRRLAQYFDRLEVCSLDNSLGGGYMIQGYYPDGGSVKFADKMSVDEFFGEASRR